MNKNINFNIEPAFPDTETINVVFCPDNKYVKYFSVLLQSIIDNSNPNLKYDFIILETDIEHHNKKVLLSMIQPHISLRFFNMSEYLKNNFRELSFQSKKYWSIATFYRLFIPFIMKDYKKVMYLDSDMVTNNSIEELFSLDFEHNELIAVTDTVSAVLDFNPKRKKYMEHKLNLQNPYHYFNAGFVIFNNSNINKDEYKNKLLDAFAIGNLLYLDQDMMNIIFKNRTKLIHNKWNLMLDGLSIENFISNITGSYKTSYIEALENPYIIHYSGPVKPWQNLGHFSEIFWKYARKTPYYETLLTELAYKNISEFIKPNWFKYYSYKIRAIIPNKKKSYYQKKFNSIYEKYKNIGFIK